MLVRWNSVTRGQVGGTSVTFYVVTWDLVTWDIAVRISAYVMW